MRNIVSISALVGISAARNCQISQISQSPQYRITNTYDVNGKATETMEQIGGVGDSDCWEKWTGWSACEGLCGQSVKTASRLCRGGIPGLQGCQGNEMRRKRCSATQRVYGQAAETYCPYWSFWAEWTSCHVQMSADPCVRPATQGQRQRTRTCHDPYATLKGETPDCTKIMKNGIGAVEYAGCMSPSAYGKPPLQAPIYAPSTDWSSCSANCGSGKQTRTLAHQCANREDTWVPREEWFQQEERPCVGAGEAACQCCMSGEWKKTTNYDECTGGSDIMTRTFTSISIQGCRQECFAQMGAGDVVFNQNTQQWTETRITIIPIRAQCSIEQFSRHSENGWGACIPQPSPWNPSVMTKCDGTGIQRREIRHPCQQKCNPSVNPECDVWFKAPCSIFEERSCGPMRTTEYFLRCSEPVPSPTGHYICEKRSSCVGDAASMTVTVEQIINGMCGPNRVPVLPPPQPEIVPAVCGCANQFKTLTTSNNECHISTQRDMCPPASVSCSMGQFTESSLLIQARADNLCVCKHDSRYYDERFEQCTKSAESGEICGSYRTDKKDSQVNSYQQDFCPGEIQCEPCTRSCQMEGQGPEVRKCWRTNLCNPDPMARVPAEDKFCPPTPPCCYETYETLIQDCQQFQCPSDIGVSTNKQVYEIRYTNPACTEVRTREVMCPAPTCPHWPEFATFGQSWSECSWKLADGTICGGNRQQSRTYPCPNDAGPGGACASIAPNGPTETRFDSHSENHHSQFCWDIQGSPENMLKVARYEAWSEWVRVGCEGVGMRKFERTQSVTNICTGEKMVHLFKTEYKTEVVVQPEPIHECCTPEKCPGIELNPCAPTVKVTIPAFECNEFASPSYTQDVTGMCPVVDRITRQYNNCDQERCVKKPGISYQWSAGMNEEEYCTGTCTETTEWLCKAPVQLVRSCQIKTEWGAWGAWFSEIPFQIGVNHQITVDGRIEEVKCNSCGGQLKQERHEVCCPKEQRKIEGRSVDCPAPVLIPGPLTPPECPKCYNQTNSYDKTQKICVQETCKIPQSGTEHCFNLPQCDKKHTIIDEICPPICVIEIVTICKHADDNEANCGMGHTHNQFWEICSDQNTKEIVSRSLRNEENTFEPCELQYQTTQQMSNMYGCTSLEERCLGGNYRRTVQQVCPEGTFYAFKKVFPAIEEIMGPCPTLDRSFTTEWIDSGCQEPLCGQQKTLTRECVNGVFQESCECDIFQTATSGCCKKDPFSSVDPSNPSIETKVGKCPYVGGHTTVLIPQTPCECGTCGQQECSTDICTRQTTCKDKIFGQDPPATVTLSECVYDQLQGHRCGVAGYKMQTTTVTCRNNRIVNEVSSSRYSAEVSYSAEPTYTIETDHITGEVKYVANSGFYGCPIIPFTNRTEFGECNYGSNRCEPTKTQYLITECEGRQINKQAMILNNMQGAQCSVPTMPEWGPWSACSVECGQGIQTRSQIDRCDPNRIANTEQRACGCEMSSWGAWSEPAANCDKCGEPVQIFNKQRVCGSNAQLTYAMEPTYTMETNHVTGEVTTTLNGYSGFGQRQNSGLPLCPRQCLTCEPGQVDIQPIEKNCPRAVEPITIIGHCPQKGDPTYCSTNTVQQRKVDVCGRIVSQEEITCRTPQRQCQESECSVPCGMGIKQMRCTDDAECGGFYYNTTSSPCQGKFGKVVTGMTHESSYGSCSKECGGGVKYMISHEVCELNQEIKLREKQISQECNMWPCAYWGIWSSWSMCSTTCGMGTRQRMRLCEGGQPGEGACYPATEKDDNGLPFETHQLGTLHIEPCGMGECCEYQWSGWSSCCRNKQQQPKKIRWKGNCGTHDWSVVEEPCNGAEQAKTNCNYMHRVHESEHTETKYVELNYNWRMGNKWTTVTNYVSRYPAPVDGDYTIGGVLYRLQQGKWYIVNFNGITDLIQVETNERDFNGIQQLYYYKFAGQWYQYINNGFQRTNYQPIKDKDTFVLTTNYDTKSTHISKVNPYLSKATNSYLAPAKPSVSSNPKLVATTYNYQKPVVPQPVTTLQKEQYQQAISTIGSSLNPVHQPAAKPEKLEYINYTPNNNLFNFGRN